MILISPSKNLNLNKESYLFKESRPFFKNKAKTIVQKLKLLDTNQIASLMNISDNLAELNYKRFQNFFDTPIVEKPAVYLFSGGTFNGLSIRSLDDNSLQYAQKKLRILSGLYGILRPLDSIQPYRLEMGTNTVDLIGDNLHSFWKELVTENLNEEVKKNKIKLLFNLASKEYFTVVNENKLNCKVINFDFKKKKENKLSNIGMMIKNLRGSMAKYILSNKINSLDELKGFNNVGFKYSEVDSTANNLVFISK